MPKIQSKSGQVCWQSPSNIALVKYWGKHGRQLPSNPSISFTLSKAYTRTSVDFVYHETPVKKTLKKFHFEGKENAAFANKVEAFLDSIKDELPFLSKVHLSIESSNSFPHSSGIASSASSMSALALCLLDIEGQVKGQDLEKQRASHFSRLGSGSASRSIYGPAAIWGSNESVRHASDTYAIPHEDLHEVFQDFHDDILIVSSEQKSVSSRAGHALMVDNPYALNRFEQAHRHLGEIVSALSEGDLEKFGDITEKEAFTLHALMMASSPPYMLMEPNTIQVIKDLQQFRRDNQVPVYFTLDAGPNVHMLYPSAFKTQVRELKEQLKPYCVEGRIIEDQIGPGPIKIK